jgi:hypothetical protein
LIGTEVSFAQDFASAVAESEGLIDEASREWAVIAVPGTVGGLSASSAMVVEWRLGSFVNLLGAPKLPVTADGVSNTSPKVSRDSNFKMMGNWTNGYSISDAYDLFCVGPAGYTGC